LNLEKIKQSHYSKLKVLSEGELLDHLARD